MQRISWKLTRKVGFRGLLIWGGVAFVTTTEPWDFSPTQSRAQDVVADQEPPKPAKVFDSSKLTAKPSQLHIFKGGPIRNSVGPQTAPPQILNAKTPIETLKLSPRQKEMLSQSKTAQLKGFAEAIEDATESATLCKDAFDRGLMPLHDFADQASANLEIQLVVADLQGDKKAKIQALSDHEILMKTVAKQLLDFNQPASKGWVADLEYANLLASNAELRLASARGDKASYQQAVERSAELADSQFMKRLEDFQTGQASLSQLANSAGFLTTATGLPGNGREKDAGPTKYDAYLNTLDDVVEQTQKLSEAGAGLGREDRLFQAQFELSKALGQSALQKKNLNEAVSSFDKAMDSAKDWFDSEVKFQQTGTASLREITQAWWSRAELTDLSARSGLTADSETEKSLDSDFQDLQKLASNTEDRQGRIEADAAYVTALGRLENLWARQRAVQAVAAAKATPPKQTRLSGGTKVIEIGPNAGNVINSATIPGTLTTETQRSKDSTIEVVTPKRNQ